MLAGFGAQLAACGAPASTPKAAPPSVVSGHVAETDLMTVTLTPQAERRLGVEVRPIERRKVAQTRILAAEVISPAAGASAATRYAATASMDPAALATAQIAADGAVAAARVGVDAARIRYDRAARLYAAEAESARARDDALAELRNAEATLQTAQAQRSLLGQSISSTRSATRLWVRASIYSGDLDRLDLGAEAQVRNLGGKVARAARPVSAPATANAISGAAFVFYEVDNAAGVFRMGERVDISIPLTVEADAITAPWSAILYDVNGGEWVYERTAEHVYSRRRVEVRSVVGDLAVLARGPAEGAVVVSTGAPEIFGAEFGVSH
jgi:multidrug efflux system membrane fusion protein